MAAHRVNVYRSHYVAIQCHYVASIVRPVIDDIQVGDTLEFNEQILDSGEFTARVIRAVVKQIDSGSKGVVKGYNLIHFNLF